MSFSKKSSRKVIMLDPSRCTGCHSCEMACSLEHFDCCGPNYSRIKIQEFREINTFIPVVCQACDDAVCIKYCPVNARVRLENGAVETDPNRCIGCRACLFGCRFGAMAIDPKTKKPMSCDLCAADPLGPSCVRACEMQKALRFVQVEDCGKAKAREWARVLQKDYAPDGLPNEETLKRAGYGLPDDLE